MMCFLREKLVIWLASFIAIANGDVVKLKFVTEPKDQISVESSVATFHCSAVATPREKLTYLWKLNGEYIDVAKVPRMSISSQGSLQLKPVKAADFGSYECVAMCEEGAIKSQSVKLKKAALSWVDNTQAVNAKEGSFHLYTPQLKTNTKAKVEWKLCSRSQAICKDLDPSRSFVTSDGNLLISPILATDDSFYPKMTIRGGKFFGVRETNMGVINIIAYLHSNPKFRCPEAVPIFLPTRRNLIVFEGENVTINCLAVLKRCDNNLVVKWTDKNSRIRSYARKLELVNVGKADEGHYTCTIDVFGDPSNYYHVQVIEKPKIAIEPPDTIVLDSSGLVSSGLVKGAYSVEWYFNAERIATSSRFYEILPNSSLKILTQSSALSGIYQILYKSRAEVLMRTINVEISKGLCGEKEDDDEGSIKFRSPKRRQEKWIHCIWIIQTSTPSIMKFYFTEFFLTVPCDKAYIDVYDGLDIRNSTQSYHLCSISLPNGTLDIKGPYIAIFFAGNGSLVNNQRFKVLYGRNLTIPTAKPTTSTAIATTTTANAATTTSKTTTKQISSSSKSTKAKTPSSRMTATVSKMTGNPSRKTSPATTVIVSTKSKKETRDSTPSTKGEGKTTKRRTINPKKSSEMQGSLTHSSKAVYIAVAVMTSILVIIMIAIIYFRRRRRSNSCSKEPLNDGFLLSSNKSSFNENKGGGSFSSKETCFTINGRPTTRYKQPSRIVAPGFESTKCDAVNGLSRNAYTVENYTPLHFNDDSKTQQYTALSFEGNKEGQGKITAPTYAVITPETEAEYMPVNSSVEIQHTSQRSRPARTTESFQPGPSLYPVYQELEIESGLQHETAGIYDSPEVKLRHPEVGTVIGNKYADTGLAPVYHVLDDLASASQKSGGLDEKKSNDDGQKNDDGYLVPCQSVRLPGKRTREPVYSQSHYIQPNPVSREDQTSISRSNTLQSVKRYQPITSDDETYLAIMK